MKVFTPILALLATFASAESQIDPAAITKALAPIAAEIKCASSCIPDIQQLCKFKDTVKAKLQPCVTKCKIDAKTLNFAADTAKDLC